MKTHLYILILVMAMAGFAAPNALARGGVDESLTGAPEPNPSPGTAIPAPAVVYESPAESVTGAPAPNPSSPGSASRPPVTYSTPNENTTPTPPEPEGDILRDDFENLHYQDEMWREHQRDYKRNVGAGD